VAAPAGNPAHAAVAGSQRGLEVAARGGAGLTSTRPRRCPTELDADEAAVEAEADAVAVGERRTPRSVVGVRQAGHQRRLDAATVAHDQGGGALRHPSTTRVQAARWASATAASLPPRPRSPA
jgi:hypothetical protein